MVALVELKQDNAPVPQATHDEVVVVPTVLERVKNPLVVHPVAHAAVDDAQAVQVDPTIENP